MTVQLDLFQEFSEVEILKQELEDVKKRNENVRKGIFARHNELCKLYMALKEELETLKYGKKEK